MSITPGKAEELKCVQHRFNSIFTFSLSVTKDFSYVIRLLLYKCHGLGMVFSHLELLLKLCSSHSLTPPSPAWPGEENWRHKR